MQSIDNTYQCIKLIPYTLFDLWDTKRYTSQGFSSDFEIVNLGSCIKEESRKYKLFLDEEKEFGILGVSNRVGIFDAYVQKGKDINQSYKKMDVGWLAYNPYRINVGSIGIKKVEHKNDYISPAYVVFSCNEKLLPEFLFLLFKTDTFNRIINESTTGSVRQNLTIDILKSLKIPLPSIIEQKKLVNNYFTKIEKAEELNVIVSKLQGEIENYFFEQLGVEKNENDQLQKGVINIIEYVKLTKWSLNYLTKEGKFSFKKSKFETEKLKNLFHFFEGGKTPSKSNPAYWGKEIFWTSPKDFSEQEILETAQDTISKVTLKDAGMKLYPKGTILSVFRSGILQHSFPTVITAIETTINQDLKAYSLIEERINSNYYLMFVKIFKQYILDKASNKGVTVESINTEDFLEIEIPLPSLLKQEEIVSHVQEIKNIIHNKITQAQLLMVDAKTEFQKEVFSL